MWIDSLATFETARASTVSVASTDIVDTLAQGDAYVNAWFVFQVTTAATISNGAPTCTIQLQTSTDVNFLDVTTTTMAASAAFVASQLILGAYWAIRIPPGVKRYIRGFRSIPVSVTNNFSALAGSQFVAADISNLIGVERYQIQ